RTGAVTPRIISGSDVDVPTFAARWPWIASLQIVADRTHVPKAVDGHSCTGSLITPTRVLVAAHCVTNGSDVEEAKYFDVIVGRRDLRGSDGERRTISAVYVDPQYDSTNLGDHDAAIVEFATPITTITPVGIVQLGDSAAWGAGAGLTHMPASGPWIAGWGARRALFGFLPVSLPGILNEGAVPIVSDSECVDGGPTAGTGWGRYFDGATMLCAGQLDTSDPSLGVPNGTTVCNGDSGGPLIVKDGLGNWKVAGITSFGSSGCSTRNAPAVFTRVDGERSWIAGTHGEPVRVVYPEIVEQSDFFDPGPTVTGDAVEQGQLGCPAGDFTGPNVTFTRAWFRTERPSETNDDSFGISFTTAQKAQFARHTSRSYTIDQLIQMLGVVRIEGATGTTYSPTRADVGVEVGCVTVATNPDWTTFAVPNPSDQVAVAGFHGSATNARLVVRKNKCGKESCTIVLRAKGAGAESLVRVGGWRITGKGKAGDLSSLGTGGDESMTMSADETGGTTPAPQVVWTFELPKQKPGARVTVLGWDDLGKRTKLLTVRIGG
ncbi:MAG: serine protease, partial [Thermoleophilia bacterium]|nr:serine protease [Thermoleophilia bacterium]